MADRDPGTLRAIDNVTSDDIADAKVKTKRKQLFGALAAGIALIGGGYTAYDMMSASKHAVTDNAYVGADVAQVTSQVTAPVAAVLVQDAQRVRRGDILVRLDDTDAKIAVARAEANLQMATRRVRGLMATDGGLGAQISARAADEMRADASIAFAKASFDKARIDLDRRKALVDWVRCRPMSSPRCATPMTPPPPACAEHKRPVHKLPPRAMSPSAIATPTAR